LNSEHRTLPPERLTLVLLWTVALALLAYGLGILILRAVLPAQLGIFEGKTLCQAWDAAQGLPIYRDPALHGVADIYTPLYPLLLSLVHRFAAPSFLWGRLLTLALAGATGFVLVRFAVREAGLSRLGGVVVAALFVSIAWYTEWFFSALKSDVLCHLLWVAGYLALRRPGARAAALAGALVALAFFAKQTALFALPGAVCVLLLTDRRRLVVFTTAWLVAMGGGFVLFRLLAGDWMGFYIFSRMRIQADHGFPVSKMWMFAFSYRWAPATLALAALGLAAWRRHGSDPSYRLWVCALPFLLGGSVLTAASEGGGFNSLLPGFYALTVLAIFGLRSVLPAGDALRPVRVGALALLLAWQMDASAPYNVSKALGRFDRDFVRLVAFLREQPGTMYAPSHNVITLLAGRSAHDDRVLAKYIEPLTKQPVERIARRMNSGEFGWLVLDKHEGDAALLTAETRARYGEPQDFASWVVLRRVGEWGESATGASRLQ
jgi:hypothetical protein